MQWINVKEDINAMLYGDANTMSQGHWVLFRWFDVGIYSKYWDFKSEQAIGGPKWKYTDFPLKTTYQLLSSAGTQQGIMGSASPNGVPGDIDNAIRLYILERCYRPKEGDIIIEYENCPIYDSSDTFIEFARTHKGIPYRITHTEDVRVDNNNSQYFLCWAKIDHRKL